MNREARKSYKAEGFSLLEVMVALALMAVSFTILLLVQGRATDLSLQARTISTATQLARLQLIECKQKAQKMIASASDWKLEGDFTELGYENFTWECHAPKFNMKTPSTSQLEEKAKKKAPEDKKREMAGSASTMSPVLSLITDSLGNAVRELVVIIRWGKDDDADEVRVVTHIIDPAPMGALGKMLKAGAESFGGKKQDDQNARPEGQGGPGGPPGGGGPMGPGMGRPGMGGPHGGGMGGPPGMGGPGGMGPPPGMGGGGMPGGHFGGGRP